MYNLTNVTPTLPGIFAGVNSFTGDALGWVIVVMIYTISLFALSSLYPTKEAFASSSFIALILTVFLWIGGIVPDYLLLILGLINAVSLTFLIVGSK